MLYKQLSLMIGVVLIATSVIPNFINILAKGKVEADDNIIIGEKVLSSNDEILLNLAKSNSNIEYLANNLNLSQEFNGGRDKLNDQLGDIKKLSAIEVLGVYELSMDKVNEISLKQKKTNKQIQRIIANYIQKSFGKQFSVYTLNEIQKADLENFINSDKKIQKLNEINSRNAITSNGGINTLAASWENCEWETSFPDWVGYEYKTFYGAKANWVGRVANEEGERSGVLPCDFSFYLNNYRANKVDGWSIATECAVKWSNGISAKRYGYSNQKMIIGHGRLSLCGVLNFNTEMMRDQIRFYS
jgi:hypothetical protein